MRKQKRDKVFRIKYGEAEFKLFQKGFWSIKMQFSDRYSNVHKFLR